MDTRYSINPEQNTITYITDPDTGQRETTSIDSLIELLLWLKYREQDIRRMVFMNSPVQVRQPFGLINGFWVGLTEDRRKVKIRDEVLQSALKAEEKRVRANWVFDHMEEVKLKRGPVHLVQYDKDGKEMPLPFQTEYHEQDTPDFLIQDALYRLRQPEFWVDKPENLDLGKYAKTM
jgi:hypothetical protein